MQCEIYQVDAFTDKIFGGNPAAVCPLDFWPEDRLMQSIGMENNLAETAFIVLENDGFRLRWFTPAIEVNLCGHATLATAHVLFTEKNYDQPIIKFYTKSGLLTVEKLDEGKYLMDFPSDHGTEVEDDVIVNKIESAIGAEILELRKGRDDYMAVLNSEQIVKSVNPDFRTLKNLTSRGTLITAPGDEVDFVSRGFFPQAGIDEDPATGSAHTLLTPYWAPRLRKNVLDARQLSNRVGVFHCIYKGERTVLIGSAVSYMKGMVNI